MKRKTGKFLLALTALLLCCGIALSARTDGRITVQLKEQSGVSLPEGNFTVTLYRIGAEDPEADTGWSMIAPFGELSVRAGMKADDLRQMAEAALEIIRTEGVEAVGSQKAGLKKEIRFDGLETGIYLGEISTKAKGLEIQPFIVAVSGRVPGETNIKEVNPKYEYNPPPTPTQIPTPTPTPTPGNETPTPGPTVSPTPSPTPGVKPVRLTIWYIYWDGRTAAPTYKHIHWPGEDYDVVSPVIPGYTATLLRVSGTMPNHDMEYTVIYIPEKSKLIPIDDYSIPLGLGDLWIHVGVCFE